MNEVLASLANTAVPELKKAYNYEPKDLGPLPVATVFWDGFPKIEDGASHVQRPTERWIVRYYEDAADWKTTQANLQKYIKAFRLELQKNPTLDGLCLFAAITKAGIVLDDDKWVGEIWVDAETESIV